MATIAEVRLIIAGTRDLIAVTPAFKTEKSNLKIGVLALMIFTITLKAALIRTFKASKFSAILLPVAACVKSSSALIVLATPLTIAFFKFPKDVWIPLLFDFASSAKPPTPPFNSTNFFENWSNVIFPSFRAV